MNEDSSISLYNRFVHIGNDLPIFLWPEWLSIVNQSHDLKILNSHDENGNEIFLPLMSSKKWGLKVLSLPPLTPFTDVVCNAENVEKNLNLLSSLINKMDAHLIQFSCAPTFMFNDTIMSQGYRSSTKISYQIDTSDDLESIFGNIKDSIKNKIKLLSDDFSFILQDDANSFNVLNAKTFNRQGKKLPYSEKLIEALHQAFHKSGNSYILMAKDHNDNFHAGLFLVNDNQTMYCLAIGSDPSLRKSDAVTALIWEAIKMAKDKGINFDFEGSSLETVEPFFRRFGGKQIQYQQFTKVSNVFLDYLLQARYKI